MKIVIISDTHNQLGQMEIPDGDILIHAGDGTGRGREYELEDFNAELGALPHKIKYFIPGNHDWLFQTDPIKARAIMTNAIVLIDELVEIEGLKIYGSPWQPAFCNWAFNLPRGGIDLAEKWSLIPEDVDILVTHGPPHSIMDEVVHVYYKPAGGGRSTARQGKRIEHVGCELLYKRVKEIKPRVHIFGHIHYSYGKKIVKWEDSDKSTKFINASSCTEEYQPINKPIVIDL